MYVQIIETLVPVYNKADSIPKNICQLITNPLGYNKPTPHDTSKANRPMLSLETCLNLLRVFIPNPDNCP